VQSDKTEIRVERSRAVRVSAVIDWLRPFARPVETQAENVRWIAARNIRATDQAEDWCTACARAEVERLNDLNPEHEYVVDGGWGSPADCPPACCKCGITLKGEFTEYAIEEEVEHYSNHAVGLRGKYAAERAFRFIQVLTSPCFKEADADTWRFFCKVERMQKRRGDPSARVPVPHATSPAPRPDVHDLRRTRSRDT
jgi:hypothetical protein